MYTRRGSGRGSGRGLGWRQWLVALLLVFLAFVLVIDWQLRPIIKSMAASQARLYATRAINNAIASAMQGQGQPYENLVTLTTGADGHVTSVQTDTTRLNLMKAQLTDAASMRIAQLEEQQLNIPLGTLAGHPLLSGRGPRVLVKVLPVGYVQSTLIHRFDEAGINQTRHQIVMELKANIVAILPGYSTSAEVITNITLAETVIVGMSPQSFTQVKTGTDQIPNLIADYGAGQNAQK